MDSLNKQILNYINARLSLRAPQKHSLELLDFLISDLSIDSNELWSLLQKKSEELIKNRFDFASLCFALATWVGKTRLMGAIIYYLYKTKWIRNFFIVAPNLTIYRKLVADFTYNLEHEKYVFKGIGDFDSNNPLIIHWDNYSDVNQALNAGLFHWDLQKRVTVNIFNISKFASRSEKTRMKAFQEVLGESYFDYLMNLEDLVIFMDESHRYTQPAAVAALNELKPILWLEFTATPVDSRGKKFENIIYEYNLANAIHDKYVKDPWVATRQNFNANMKQEEIDFIKVSDGVQYHEEVKRRLELYHKDTLSRLVKPLLMISAIDQNHADLLENMIRSDDFFEWRYKDKVLKVYSNQTGEIKDDMIEKLLKVERLDNPVEIIVQVMMLKEGWDVNNLYTIVPLRASAAEILTEQTIGRGLRLPYGEWTWDSWLDRLVIIAHDRYNDVVNIAKDPNSLVRNIINLDDIEWFGQKKILVDSKPIYEDIDVNLKGNKILWEISKQQNLSLEETEKVQSYIQWVALEQIKRTQDIISSIELLNPEITQSIVENVKQSFETVQKIAWIWSEVASKAQFIFAQLTDLQKEKLISNSVTPIIQTFVDHSIDIPRVMVEYGEPERIYKEWYQLNVSFIEGLLPIESNIVLTDLASGEQEILYKTQMVKFSWTLTDYIVNLMMEVPEIRYDECSNILYSLATQFYAAIEKRFPNLDEDKCKYIVRLYRERIYKELESQIRQNVVEIRMSEPYIKLAKSFELIKSNNFSYVEGGVYNFRDDSFEKSRIRSYIFDWFSKCVHKQAKFDSDSERKFAVLLEDESKVIKWMKPPLRAFKIGYYVDGKYSDYNPDFVVETTDKKYIIEVKAENEADDNIVQVKAKSAKLWVQTINDAKIWKPWQYLIISHHIIQPNNTFDFLISNGL